MKAQQLSSSEFRAPRLTTEKEFLPDGGPPREVIIRLEGKRGGDGDALLDEILSFKSSSTVSSLGVGGPAVSNKKQHDLDRVLGDIEDEDGAREGSSDSLKNRSVGSNKNQSSVESQRNNSKNNSIGSFQRHNSSSAGTGGSLSAKTESAGLAAARDRYKSKYSSMKTPLIHHFKGEEEDEPIVTLEEVSLGVESSAKVDENDIGKEVKTRRYREHGREQNVYKAAELSDDTSKTASGTESPPSSKSSPKKSDQKGLRSHSNKKDGDYDDDHESASATDDDDASSAATNDLLERAHDRLTMQKLHDEIDQLKKVIQVKNGELEVLAGQLRRAIETKCDLVLSHTELERHHEFNLKAKEEEKSELKKVNFGMIENLASVEKDLLNEIVRLNLELQESRKQHFEELQDWERLHKNEMVARDFEIAKLTEEIRMLLLKNDAGKPLRQMADCR